ncbi:serine protease ami-like [Phymastichus coffea]|uniref:serine protease ami-like n=1 Tax=Phymastichus coffea TaxID=108790 RepID=UPI00273B0918|nr:serine protease ami-like [Phymastichus coffea]
MLRGAEQFGMATMDLATRYLMAYLALLTAGWSRGTPLRGQLVRAATCADRLSFVVAIMRLNDSICTGVLISRQNVLTVKHCLTNQEPSAITVAIGSCQLDEAKSHRVSTWRSFDQWNNINTDDIIEYVNDVAIITLAERVSDQRVKPVVLCYSDVHSLDNSTVRLAGWGLNNNGTTANTLQTVLVKVVSLRICVNKATAITGIVYRIPDHFFCSVADPWALRRQRLSSFERTEPIGRHHQRNVPDPREPNAGLLELTPDELAYTPVAFQAVHRRVQNRRLIIVQVRE